MKKLFQRILNSLGYEIKKFNIYNSPDLQLIRMLEMFEINTIIDVGANEGQFSIRLRELGYKDKIISFEPMASPWKVLKHFSKHDLLWLVPSRTAIGDFTGEVEINISSNSESSSILPMLDEHSAAVPESIYEGKEKVEIDTLDNLVTDYIDSSSNIFIKIDTQGFEEEVLNGGKVTIDKCIGVQLELSLIELYEGQKLWDYFIPLLLDKGFELWSISPVFVNPEKGRMLQIDATFFKKEG